MSQHALARDRQASSYIRMLRLFVLFMIGAMFVFRSFVGGVCSWSDT